MLCIVLATGASLVPWAVVSVPAVGYLLFWIPGRMLVQLLRPLRNQPGWQWSALAGSLMLMPVVLHWTWWLSNSRPAILSAIVLTDVALVLAAKRWGGLVAQPTSPLFESRRQRALFGLLVAWVAGLVFLVYYLPMAGDRLLSNPSGDYIKHHAIVWSLTQYPLPLHNLYYAVESSTPYFYYEHFYLLPAALCVVTDHAVSIPTAFGIAAGVVTATFLGMILLLARAVIGSMAGAVLAVICASVVGGLDIIPTVLYCLKIGHPVVILDVWCPVPWRIHNLMNDYVWCPQHVAATGTLLFCAYALQQALQARWWMLLAPLAAVSVFGMSVYQAMVFFPAAALWVLLDVRACLADPRRRTGRLLLGLAGTGLLAAAVMLPQGLQYREMDARFEGGLTLEWLRFDFALLGRLVPPGPLANLLDAPWLLLVDFGIGAVAAVVVTRSVWRRLWSDAGLRLLMLAGGLGVALMWTVRSSVNRYDYGFRLASMPALVVAAILSGFLVHPLFVRSALRRVRLPLLVAGLLVGLPVGLYETPGLAFRTLFEPKPERAEADALRFLRDELPAGAVVQACPERYDLPQLIDQQIGVLNPENSHVNVLCPRDKPTMLRAVEEVRQAFRTDDACRAHALFARWKVTHVYSGPREHKWYGDLSQLADPRWFKIVYDDGQSRVVRLREPAGGKAVSCEE